MRFDRLREMTGMQSLKKLFIHKLIFVGLSLGMIVNVWAMDFETIKNLAEQGSAEHQSSLGAEYYVGESIQQDYSKAFYWFQKSANQGYNAGQMLLGINYYYGKGVRQDYSKAFYWFQKSARQKNVFAQFFVGAMYEQGNGVRQNIAQAKEWYGKACDNGFQDGCNEYRRLNIK